MWIRRWSLHQRGTLALFWKATLLQNVHEKPETTCLTICHSSGDQVHFFLELDGNNSGNSQIWGSTHVKVLGFLWIFPELPWFLHSLAEFEPRLWKFQETKWIQLARHMDQSKEISHPKWSHPKVAIMYLKSLETALTVLEHWDSPSVGPAGKFQLSQ